MRVDDPFEPNEKPQPLSDGVDPILATAIDSQPKSTKTKAPASKPPPAAPTETAPDVEVSPIITSSTRRSNLAPWLVGGAVVALGALGFVLGGRK